MDNCLGKIGGDSPLTESGRDYGTVLYNFISEKRRVWEEDQKKKVDQSLSLPPRAGDTTPPYPDLMGDLEEKNFCVWTSMLKRSIETAHCFDTDEEFDVKNWDMLNELNAGMWFQSFT
jgi:6-phosphofructo-2-kinase